MQVFMNILERVHQSDIQTPQHILDVGCKVAVGLDDCITHHLTQKETMEPLGRKVRKSPFS